MTTAEQEMPFPEDTREQISDLSSDLSRLAGAMSGATQLGQWDGQGVPSWVGEAADAYVESIRLMHGKLGPVVDGMRHAAAQADAWYTVLGDAIDRGIPELHDQWREVERKMAEAQAELDAAAGSHSPVPSAPGREGAMDPSFEAAKLDLKEEYASLIRSLNEAAHTAAQQVGVAREMFLPPEVGSSRDEIGQELFKDGSILEAQTKWEHAQDKAEEIADQLEQGFIGDDSATADEKAEEFLRRYGDDLEDPFVATALATVLPPEALVDHGIRGLDAIQRGDLKKSFAQAVGTTMVLASGGMNLSPDQRQDQELYLRYQPALFETRVEAEHFTTITIHQDYANKLTLMTDGSVKIGPKGMWTLPAVEAAAQLMGAAGIANPDLSIGPGLFQRVNGSDSFMDKVLRHDELLLHRQGLPPEGLDSRLIDRALDPKLEDPVFAMTTLMDSTQAVPLAGDEAIREAELERQGSVKQWLASDIHGLDTNGDGQIGKGDRTINVTEYIMGGRTVNDPNVYQNGEFAPYSGFPDGGVQFAKVAAEAALPELPEDLASMSRAEKQFWLKREEEGVRIAKGYLLGYQNGLDVYRPEGVKEIEGQQPFGYHNAEGRNLAADVLGPRLKGIGVSMSGSRNRTDGKNPDDLSDEHLIVLDDDTVEKLRGPKGVFADLAFDGAADYAQAVEDMAQGKPPKFENPSATDKLLTWASWGYEKDLRASFDAVPIPLDTVGGSKVVESTEGWVHIVNTLFAAPDQANSLQLQAVANRNAVWNERAENMVALSKAAASEFPGGGLIGEFADRAIIQPALDDMFPSDFQLKDLNTSKRAPTERFMMGILAAVAADEIDFSQAPKSEKWLEKLRDNGIVIFREDGSVLPYGEMTDDARGEFHDYLTQDLPSWEFDDAKEKVRNEVTIAHQERSTETDQEDVKNKGGLAAEEEEDR